MKINFLSEFPSEELEYAEDLQDEAIVFMAAESLEEFRGYKKRLNQINPEVEAGYWPYFEKSVWISPFIEEYELEKLEKEVSELDSKIMFDLEPPVLRPEQFLNLRGFRRRKRRIQDLANRYDDQVYLVEQSRPVIADRLYRLAGLSFAGHSIWDKMLFKHVSSNEESAARKIEMLYSSTVSGRMIGHLRRQLLKRDVDYPAFGVTNQGPLEKENVLDGEQLRDDLEWARQKGFEEVFIYRLEGLNSFRDVFNDFL